jgi:hypothetical protein
MKNTRLLLLGAIAGSLSLASCTQDKKAETTTTTTAPAAGDTAVVISTALTGLPIASPPTWT